jgi:hypothetical protein
MYPLPHPAKTWNALLGSTVFAPSVVESNLRLMLDAMLGSCTSQHAKLDRYKRPA